MQQDQLTKHVLGTYFSLRVGIAVIAILFPLILWIGGWFYAGLPLQDSMSAYYHAAENGCEGGRSMRNWFVGILFAIGVFLYLYKGFSTKENIALNLSGIFAIGIAIFPMDWHCDPQNGVFSMHGFCAVLFFLCISYVCVRCAPETLEEIPNERTRTRFGNAYRWFAVAMIASPLTAFILNWLTRQQGALVFFVETVGIATFSAYWLTKSYEFSLTQAEKKSMTGTLKIKSMGVL